MIKNPNYLIIILIIIKIITTIAIMIVITTILIIILIIIVMIKRRNTCRTLTAPNTELSVTCDIQRPKRRSYHKKLYLRRFVSPLCASETAHSALKVINKGISCCLNSLLGTLLHLISQEQPQR